MPSDGFSQLFSNQSNQSSTGWRMQMPIEPRWLIFRSDLQSHRHRGLFFSVHKSNIWKAGAVQSHSLPHARSVSFPCPSLLFWMKNGGNCRQSLVSRPFGRVTRDRWMTLGQKMTPTWLEKTGQKVYQGQNTLRNPTPKSVKRVHRNFDKKKYSICTKVGIFVDMWCQNQLSRRAGKKH